MQFNFNDVFLIISEILLLTSFLYILSLQLLTHGGLKVTKNAYTFTSSVGILIFISLIIQFNLVFFKLNLSYSVFNDCLEFNSITNYFINFLIIITSICLIFIIKINYVQFQQILKFEIYYLIILCLTGGLFIILSNDLLILFLSLELYNFGLYSIIGLQQNRIINTEISIKYYLVSALSSSFILFGISLIYGFSGLLNLNELNLFFIDCENLNLTLILGFSLILIGIFIKLGAAPFHFWTPDIYEGASNIVNLILLTLPKIILTSLLIKIIFSTVIYFSFNITILMYILILCSFYFGTFGAIHQIKIKKFFNFSGISNFGLCSLHF